VNRPITVARAGLMAAALVACLALAGCTAQSSSLADDYNKGDNGGNYISGDGNTVVIAAGKRTDAIDFAGASDADSTISSADLAGQVVLVNFWYAGCGPCRSEAQDLEALHEQFGDRVAFVGVNTADGAAVARSFAEKFGVTYPSILDLEDNDVVLAFAGDVPPNAVPTTLLLDKQGRVAARFSGAISSPDVVSSVLDDLLAEKS
jgi:thiol-disulfide isomerase/thioredoxin